MTVIDRICAEVADEQGDLTALVTAAARRLSPLSTGAERRQIVADSLARITGLGQLERLVADPEVDEVLVNGADVWVDRGGRLTHGGELRATTTEQLIERILAPLGRRVDPTTPIVDARLPDGARVCAVVPPVAVSGPTLSIRRFATHSRPLSDFAPPDVVDLCRDIVTAGANVVVTGATSSGKTSLLAALLGEADPDDRIIVLEDTAELPCNADHLVRLEARPPSSDGLAAIPLSELVRTALRLRPDRLVVGEVRSDEVLALVQAMNTGHDGSFSTCHANGALDALFRLESLVLQAAPQWPLHAVRRQLARSIDVVIHVARRADRRRIETIAEVVDADTGEPEVRSLASTDANGDVVVEAELTRRRR